MIYIVSYRNLLRPVSEEEGSGSDYSVTIPSAAAAVVVAAGGMPMSGPVSRPLHGSRRRRGGLPWRSPKMKLPPTCSLDH